MLYGPNTNNGSILFMLECQVAYIMRQLRRMDDEGLAWIDVRPDVMERYNDELQARPRPGRRVAGRLQQLLPRRRAAASSPSGRTPCSSTAARTLRPDPDAYEVQRGATLASSTLL